MRNSENLYKSDCVEALTERSRLSGVVKDDHKKNFAIWVKLIYEEFIDNRLAEIIMKIVTSSSKVIIHYLPRHDNVDAEENLVEFICEGVTYAHDEQIIIAAKNYQDDEYRNRLKGVIVHEFCHFAVYETFCNGYKGKWI